MNKQQRVSKILNDHSIFWVKKHHPGFFPVLFLFLLVVVSFSWHPLDSYGQEMFSKIETIILCEGTRYQTIVYRISSQQKGPHVMIMAGVHGNETAGIKAIKEFIVSAEIQRGLVIFIPEANKEACENKVRSMPSEKDLNRIYPGDLSSQNIDRLAGEIFALMKNQNIDFLLDLHESVDYYQNNAAHYGQTIILDKEDHPFLKKISHYLLDQLNNKVVLPKNKFQVIIKPIQGCSTYEALNQYNIPGITFETCRKIEFGKRVSFHYQSIENILTYFELIS